jgi:hypothetical protein
MPVQYGRHAAHISWAGLRADTTWGLHGGEATPSERELFKGNETFMEERETFSRTEKETEWRFCRAQIVRDWTPTFSAAYISGRLPQL